MVRLSTPGTFSRDRLRLNNGGFTLFETLTATMIFAIALVVVLQIFSGGLRSNRVSTDYTQAMFHAREKMEELLLLPGDVLQDSSGQWEDGFSWKAQMFPLETAQDEEETGHLIPVQIDLEISWTDGDKVREAALSTIRLNKRVPDEK